MPDGLYEAWKRAIVVAAFRHRGIDAPVDDLFRVPLASRRRSNVYARRYRKNLHVGFYRAATHEHHERSANAPSPCCSWLAALPALREMLEPSLRGQAEAAINMLATPAGLDVQMECVDARLDARTAAALAALAARPRLRPHLTVDGETVVWRDSRRSTFGGVERRATARGLRAGRGRRRRTRWCAWCWRRRPRPSASPISSAASAPSRFPWRGAPACWRSTQKGSAIQALQAAARRAQGLKPIETKVRDLFRMPLSAKELEGFDAVVFDPARSGAEEQASELARCKARTVVAVSCNPGTLARDVRILIDGGYALERVTPIDQFLYSHHVEAVAVLRR